MKKAGSSSSKSKTRRTSKSTSPDRGGGQSKALPVEDASDLAQAMAVGHRPARELSPQDEALFRAFQSNLLSLISHELRTPLMGILNALTLLEQEREGAGGDLTPEELLSMARSNAQRLQRALSALLDLAALESGTFRARLREVDLSMIVEGRLEGALRLFRDQNLTVKREGFLREASVAPREGGQTPLAHAPPLLADPQKLGRAVELCLQVIAARAQPGSTVQIRISSARTTFVFSLKEGTEKQWEQLWLQGLAGFQGGVASPTSAFAGTLQSEESFLRRMEEGLGSEFLLIHEIMRLHGGKCGASVKGRRDVSLVLELPELSSEDGLRAVLASRADRLAPEQGGTGSVSLGLVQVPEGVRVEEFQAQVKRSLFRASDAVYALPRRRQLALVLDDCKPEDAPRLLARIEKGVGHVLKFGIANCPSEGVDPGQLIDLANRRLQGKPVD